MLMYKSESHFTGQEGEEQAPTRLLTKGVEARVLLC